MLFNAKSLMLGQSTEVQQSMDKKFLSPPIAPALQDRIISNRTDLFAGILQC